MPRLLGPVFFYDLLRTSRKGRYLLLRCLFVLLLFGLLWLAYRTYGELLLVQMQATRAQAAMYARQGFMAPPPPAMLDTSIFGEKFFSWYFIVQYVVIVLVTPAMVAGAVAEEKQRQTIEYLFTSDIHNHEIILGKLCSRLMTMVMLLLAGLPVLSIVQWFGGISWELLVAGFSACLVTIFSLGSISLYQSVKARRVREALGKAYLVIVLYFVGWGMLLLFRMIMAADVKAGSLPLQVMDGIIEIYNTGNPITSLVKLAEETQRRGSLSSLPFELLWRYGAFHLVIGVICLFFSITRVRRVYVRQMYQGQKSKRPPKKLRALFRPVWGKGKSRRHPPLAEREPLAWKERWFERNLRFGPVVQAIFVVGMGVLLLPGVVFAAISVLAMIQGQDYGMYVRGWGEYFRFLGAFLFALAMMGITIRAAGSIGSEKDRQTWEVLLSAPVWLRRVFWTKWWASFTTPRWFYWIWLTMIGMAGLSYCIHPFSIPTTILLALALASFAASLGMWFAARSRSALQAIIGSVLVLLVMTFAGIFIELIADQFWVGYWQRNQYAARTHFFLYAAPLISLGFTLQTGHDLEQLWSARTVDQVNNHVAVILACSVWYGGLALFLYWRGSRNLARQSGRVDESGCDPERMVPSRRSP